MRPDPSTSDQPCPAYSAVIPLRILALKKSDPELWSRVQLLMDHVGEMKEEERNMWEVGESAYAYKGIRVWT